MNNPKTKWLISLIAVALMLSVVTAVSAQGNVVATLSAGNGPITVGDVIPLTLRVTHPAGWRVIAPALARQWGEFEVRRQAIPVITANGDGTETTSQQIDVIRLRPGEASTPALTLSITDDQGNLTNVEVAPLSIAVESVLIAGDTNLRDIKPQADLITAQRSYWPIVTVAALGLIALSGYAVNRWRQRALVDKRTPRERALAALQTIEARQPQTSEEIKAAHIDIAACLRGYLASTTDVLALDLTTNEIARRLKLSAIPVDWSSRALDVLHVCDSVKFAADSAEATTIHGLVSITKGLVEQYPPAPAPADKRGGHRKQVKVTA